MTAPDPTPLRDRLITALAVAGGWNPNRLEPHDFQDEATGILAIVQPLLDAKDTETQQLRTELAMAQSGPLTLDRDSWQQLAGLANERADRIAAERDRAIAGVPLICSDERHQAKVRGLEAERDQFRAHHGQIADHAISLDADLAIFREAVSQYSGQLEEARDLLSNAGHNRAHLDDWPDIIPALQELIAERDQLRTVARSAAVLLRATADRPSDPTVLRAAAAAIDELAPKET